MNFRQEIKQREKHIIELLQKNKNENTPARMAWKQMLIYYEIKDYLEGSNHIEIIASVYNYLNFSYKTLFRLADDNHIGERTIYRYRKQYLSCFEFCYRMCLKMPYNVFSNA